MMDTKNMLSKISLKLLDQHRGFTKDNRLVNYPNTKMIIEIIDKIKTTIFPGYFNETPESEWPNTWVESLLTDIHQMLSEQIKTALLEQNDNKDAVLSANDISVEFLEQLTDIQKRLYKDAKAGFEGDPAAQSIDEIILTYPGFFAVFVYRIAHFLFLKDVPFIPRLMGEYAHSITGIDIHPGAEIGEYFFIDHGTGVVIGETTVIGNYVKLYQGVTLGALSTKSGQKLVGIKRHPTIEDSVTIYSGASILGGETVIGKNSTIGGNVFVTKSVPPDTTIKGT